MNTLETLYVQFRDTTEVKLGIFRPLRSGTIGAIVSGMKQIVKLNNLQPGQQVALANCREPASVVRREGKNLYRVQWQGREFSMPRASLAVCRDGRWQFGPVNAN